MVADSPSGRPTFVTGTRSGTRLRARRRSSTLPHRSPSRRVWWIRRTTMRSTPAARSTCSTRYEPVDRGAHGAGVAEDRSLDFHSPYGCSKGTADQYVLDYARSFGLRTVVFRMSCIYGPHQFGTEDQGWLAHFLVQAIEGRPIALYGDGRQVRDVLFVDDLVDAFLQALAHLDRTSGRAFNVGGGPAHTTSLLELLDLIAVLHGERPDLAFGEWRTGDQRYYVSDTRRFQAATGWAPRVSVQAGVGRLYRWLLRHRPRADASVGVAVAAAAGAAAKASFAAAEEAA